MTITSHVKSETIDANRGHCLTIFSFPFYYSHRSQSLDVNMCGPFTTMGFALTGFGATHGGR